MSNYSNLLDLEMPIFPADGVLVCTQLHGNLQPDSSTRKSLDVIVFYVHELIRYWTVPRLVN